MFSNLKTKAELLYLQIAAAVERDCEKLNI